MVLRGNPHFVLGTLVYNQQAQASELNRLLWKLACQHPLGPAATTTSLGQRPHINNRLEFPRHISEHDDWVS